MELLTAFFLIFMAEMGDKTQILAMAFATKYKIKQVLIGIFIGSLLNHALAVLLGANLYRIIPIDTLSIIAGLSFILFGVWNLRQDTEDNEENKTRFGPILTVSLAFFIGELGDKTQLTAIILATDASSPLLILTGTVLGMVFTGFIGILVGIKLGSKIDEFYIKITASLIFFIFGYIKLLENGSHYLVTPLSISLLSIIVISLSTILLVPVIKNRKQRIATRYQKQAIILENYYSKMYQDIDDICLGENTCGKCDGTSCLVGYTKHIITQARNNNLVNTEDLTTKLNKGYSRTKVLEALKDTLLILKEDWNNKNYIQIHEIRMVFERIMYKQSLNESTYTKYLDKLQYIDNHLYQKIK